MCRTNYRSVIGWRSFVGWCDPVVCCLSLTVGPCLMQGDVLLGYMHTHGHAVHYSLEVFRTHQLTGKILPDEHACDYYVIWLECNLLNICWHYDCWNNFLCINLSLYIRMNLKTNVWTEICCFDYLMLLWNISSSWLYMHTCADSEQSLIINLLHSVVVKSFWVVAFGGIRCLCQGIKMGQLMQMHCLPQPQSYHYCINLKEAAVPEVLQLCRFSGIKPTPITAVATGCLVAHTQDHSADFQIWVFYLYSVWECEGASAHVSCLPSRVTVVFCTYSFILFCMGRNYLCNHKQYTKDLWL